MEPSSIFVKRTGTTDLGKDYEDLTITYLSLKYLTDENINQFFLSSNHKDFGSFDDIIIEVDCTKRSALQLKHVASKEKASLPTKLGAASGPFSITKYCNDLEQLTNVNDFHFILFTNFKLDVPDNGLTIKLAAENIDIKATKMLQQEDIFGKTGRCFKFEVIGASNAKYEKFFGRFSVCANEPDVGEVEKYILDEFKQKFGEVQLMQYVKFVQQWSKREGVKNKLDRNFLPKALAVHMLSHVIKPFIFSMDETFQRAEILRGIICSFDITITAKKNSTIVQKLWGNFDLELGSMEQINETARSFYILSEKISDFRQLNNETKTKLLWLEDKYPLIIDGCPNTYEVIKLCPSKKFIVLADMCNEDFKSARVFQKLTDLDQDSTDYHKLLTTFHVSLKNEKKITLQKLFTLDENIKSFININHLFQMVNGSFSMSDVVTILVQSNSELNILYQQGYPPVHVACIKNDTHLASLIVQSDMDVSSADKDGNTPIYIACANGNQEIAKLLLDSNVDLQIANVNGETPLLIACLKGNHEVVEMLLRSKANVNIVTKDGESLLQIASVKGDAKMVAILLKNNVSLTAANKDGDTALYLAALNGHDKVVKLLIEAGASLNSASKDGETSLFAASAAGFTEVVRLLAEAKANLNVSNKEANTALHMAYLHGHKDVVNLLIAHAANEHVGNMFGKKPSEMVGC